MRSLLVAAVLISGVTNSSRAEDAPSPLTAPFDVAQAKAAQEAWAKYLGKASPVEKNSIGMELVLIPPGKFTMGSPPSEMGRDKNENQVDVMLTKAFYLGKTEVTQRQWHAVMGTASWRGEDYARGDNYAETYLSWEDAQAFCKKLSEKEKRVYRLPTEAEWEYACRGGATTRFGFGDDESQLGEFAWYRRNAVDAGGKHAHEVGHKNPNPFGLHDMHGNIWEWCEDVYAAKLPGGTDPVVSTGITARVLRGGCWRNGAAFCRSGIRFWNEPDYLIPTLGFRPALSSGQ